MIYKLIASSPFRNFDSRLIKEFSGITYCSFSSPCDTEFRKIISNCKLSELGEKKTIPPKNSDLYKILNHLHHQNISLFTFTFKPADHTQMQWALYRLDKRANGSITVELKLQNPVISVNESQSILTWVQSEKETPSPSTSSSPIKRKAEDEDQEAGKRPHLSEQPPDLDEFSAAHILLTLMQADPEPVLNPPVQTEIVHPEITNTTPSADKTWVGWAMTTDSQFKNLTPDQNIFVSMSSQSDITAFATKSVIKTFMELQSLPFSTFYSPQDPKSEGIYMDYFGTCLSQQAFPVENLKAHCEAVRSNEKLGGSKAFFFEVMYQFLSNQ